MQIPLPVSRVLAAFCLVALTLVLPGCGAQKKTALMESDVNGYQCAQCKAKYYTDPDVYAVYCPACKKGTPMGLIAYVCPADKAVNIVMETARDATCETCKAPVYDKKLPKEAELKAWGAVKKTKQEVSQNP